MTAFAALLVLVFISRAIPLFFQPLPPGWDPTFHLLLTKKLLLSGHLVMDWEPFAAARLHYPLGSHLLIAVTAKLTGWPLETVFQWAFPLLGVVSTALVFYVAKAVTADESLALSSAGAYGLLALFGSIDYYGWGGLPNEMAMCFVLGLVILMVRGDSGPWQQALFGICAAAVIIVHHHTAVTAVLILIACGGLWRFRIGLVGGMVVGALVLFPYWREIAHLGQTRILQVSEPFYTPQRIVTSLGLAFTFCAAIGLAWCIQERPAWPGWRMWRRILLTLTILFVGLGIVVRGACLVWLGQDISIFTPSRFLTDLVYFLAIPAGYGLTQMTKNWCGGKPLRIAVLWTGLVLSNIPVWRNLCLPQTTTEMIEAGAWMSTHLPAKTLVVSRHPWMPYLAWRPTLETPLPVSEVDTDPQRAERLLQEMPPDWTFVSFRPNERVTIHNEEIWRSATGVRLYRWTQQKPT